MTTWRSMPSWSVSCAIQGPAQANACGSATEAKPSPRSASHCRLATLLKLAAALGVTLTELLGSQPLDRPVAVVSRHDAMTLWSTPHGGAACLLVSHGPLELWTWTLQPGDRRTSLPHRAGALELL